MKVEHVERGRFIVTDQSGDRIVDVLCYEGSGKCDCWHFMPRRLADGRRVGLQVDIEDDKRAGTFKPGLKYQCSHIQAADRELLMMFKQQLLKQFPDNDLDTQT